MFAYAAFGELNTTRGTAFGMGPIPWTAINDYAARYDITGDFFDHFIFVIRVLDDAYLTAVNSRK